MEWVSCNLCGHDNHKRLYDFTPWQIVKCKHCGLVYLNPRPSDEELFGLYSEDYFAEHLVEQYPRDEEAVRRKIDSFEWMLNIVRPFKERGTILEIGCATGFFLAHARNAGWEAWGVEISEYAAQYARESLGLKVLTGTVSTVNLPKRFFDVIMMSHILEHLPDPLNALRQVGEWLKHDGILVIRVPDIGSLDAIFYGRNWEGWRIPYHFYHFSPRSLRAMLRRVGFSVLMIDYWVSPLVVEPIQRLFRRWWEPTSIRTGSVSRNPVPRRGRELVFSLRKLRQVGYRVFKCTFGRFLRGRTMTVIAVQE